MTDTEALPKLELFYDFMKHLTTLATGALVLVVTFSEKLATNSTWVWLFYATVVFLLLSVVCSLICMFLTCSMRRYATDDDIPVWEKYVSALSILGSFGSFLLGLVALTMYAIRNFST